MKVYLICQHVQKVIEVIANKVSDLRISCSSLRLYLHGWMQLSMNELCLCFEMVGYKSGLSVKLQRCTDIALSLKQVHPSFQLCLTAYDTDHDVIFSFVSDTKAQDSSYPDGSESICFCLYLSSYIFAFP